ncbi:hypothetical protein [Pseudovibrio sp. Tun.PSC04-5.I4]|uniref:hypothetical protein n=1 Tax=Pseudovibrio sp. Tun.PSC04-5.I4 TaxID=1798213 RepID=UPI000891DC7D|nr:hypothetical protein [Pseudovibrio sp. Tun.PSC04-5.I4]SDR49074.1 Transcriptional activator TraM [Pseudovibrio sp. Tun.PSC04-5.I4]
MDENPDPTSFEPDLSESGIEPGTDFAPYGRPMTKGQAQRILAETHGVVVGDRDPILMLVTLLQGFHKDQQMVLGAFERQVNAAHSDVQSDAQTTASALETTLQQVTRQQGKMLEEAAKVICEAVETSLQPVAGLGNEIVNRLGERSLQQTIAVVSSHSANVADFKSWTRFQLRRFTFSMAVLTALNLGAVAALFFKS